MTTFEITKVDASPSTWTAKKGPAAGQEFHSYKVTAKGPDGEKDYEINRKPSSGPPPLGVVEADVQPSSGDFPDKLKLTFQGRSGGSSNGFKPDPERSRRIERQHSQEMALRFLSSEHLDRVTHDQIQIDDAAEFLSKVVAPVIDWFQKDLDVDGGGSSGERGATSTPTSSVTTAAVSTGFASQKQRAYYERLLKNPQWGGEREATVTRYLDQAPKATVSAAIDALKDGNDAECDGLLNEAANWAAKQSNVPWDESQ